MTWVSDFIFLAAAATIGGMVAIGLWTAIVSVAL
jgi:hypothetical protein